jgi:hypothetical protein
MRKRFLRPLVLRGFCCLIGLLPFRVAAEDATPPSLPFLYSVRADENSAPSYLLGSIHVTSDRITRFIEAAEPLIAESDLLATEIDLSPRGFTAVMRAMTADPAAGSTFARMPEELGVKAEAFFGQLMGDMPASFYSAFEPWALVLTASLAELESLNMGQPMDVQLHYRARANGVPTTGIETIDEHLAALRALTDEECWLALEATIDGLESGEIDIQTEVEALLQAYYDGDADALLAVGLTEFGTFPELAELESRLMYGLLNVRNRGMADWVAAQLETDPGKQIVAVVGALHLVGDENVPDLLRARGLLVERIPPTQINAKKALNPPEPHES